MAVSFRIASTTTASSGTNIVLNKDVSVVEGDLMIAQLFVEASSAPTITPPAGWTSRGSGTGSVTRAQIFTKIAGAGEPSSYTFTSSLTIVAASASLSAYSSDNGIIIGDYEFDSVAKSPSVAPSVDVVTANSKLFCAFETTALGSGVTGMSARVALDNGARDIATFDQDIASPGATVTKTYSGSSTGWGFSLSIEEAVAASPSAGLERMLGGSASVELEQNLTPITGLSRLARFPADDFNVDSTGEYTQHADTAGTWEISNGELVATGGANDLFIRNGTSYTDVAIEADCNWAQYGGLVLRFTDANNYYMCELSDDSGGVPSQNIRIVKIVAGAYTALIGNDISWARGSSKTIRFQASGATLSVYVDGVLLRQITDSSLSGPGGVGLRHNWGAQSSKYQAFRWNLNVATPTVELGQDVFPIDGLMRVQGDTPAVELAWTPQAGLMRMIGQTPTLTEETGGLWGQAGAASGSWGKAGVSGSGSWGKAPIAH